METPDSTLENLFTDPDLVTKLSQIETAYQIGDMSFVNDARKELVYNLLRELSDSPSSVEACALPTLLCLYPRHHYAQERRPCRQDLHTPNL